MYFWSHYLVLKSGEMIKIVTIKDIIIKTPKPWRIRNRARRVSSLTGIVLKYVDKEVNRLT